MKDEKNLPRFLDNTLLCRYLYDLITISRGEFYRPRPTQRYSCTVRIQVPIYYLGIYSLDTDFFISCKTIFSLPYFETSSYFIDTVINSPYGVEEVNRGTMINACDLVV